MGCMIIFFIFGFIGIIGIPLMIILEVSKGGAKKEARQIVYGYKKASEAEINRLITRIRSIGEEGMSEDERSLVEKLRKIRDEKT